MKNFVLAHLKQFIIAGSIFITLGSATASYFYLAQQRMYSVDSSPSALTIASQVDTSQAPEDLTSLTTVLLGYGGAGHDGGHLTDVIQVAHLDFEQQRLYLISIPRDLWVQLPNGQANKINAAYSLEADQAKVLKEMVQTVTGITPNYFIGIDFVGFQRLIGETLDGITVNVTEVLDDPWYPIRGEELNLCGKSPAELAELHSQYSGFELEKQFECRYEHLHFPVGEQQLEGKDALAYVRSRHGSAGGDFSRSRRQHEVLAAVKTKLISLQTFENLPAFFELAVKHTKTDLDLEIVKYLAPALINARNYEIKTIVLSTENVFTPGTSASGQSIVVPKQDWNQVRAYLHAEMQAN